LCTLYTMAAPPRQPNQDASQSRQRQPQQQQQAQEPRQQVTINTALDTLCAMFESVDRDVVHMILIEGCGGNMESAVEALLTMTGGISQKDKQKQKAQQQKQQPPKPAAAPAQAQQQLMNLPADFLRPPSYFLSKFENDHEMDAERAAQRQMVEDEMFAKAIFEDSLFAADLHANPEWVLEEMSAKKKVKAPAKAKGKFSWRAPEQEVDLDNVDPSDVNARRLSFKQRFNTLGSAAKHKLGELAQKMQRNKQEQKQKGRDSAHQYRNVLTSLDDEALIDEDDQGNNAIIEVASEDNRGTYQAPMVPQKPVKPSQQL